MGGANGEGARPGLLEIGKEAARGATRSGPLCSMLGACCAGPALPQWAAQHQAAVQAGRLATRPPQVACQAGGCACASGRAGLAVLAHRGGHLGRQLAQQPPLGPNHVLLVHLKPPQVCGAQADGW